MKAEQVHQHIEEALAGLTGSLAAGRSETLRRFLAAMARFHDYSWHNVMLILSQRPEATKVAGFNAWRSLGRYVMKGERGIGIIAPMMVRRDEGATRDGDDRVLRFRVVHVFDVSQTDGEPLPELDTARGDPGFQLTRLTHAITDHGVRLVYGDLPHGVDGASSGGLITVRPGLAPAEEFRVLAHELAHELLHQGPDAERGTKPVREAEADAVAYVVATASGLDMGTSTADYLQLHGADRETVTASMGRIQRTAAAILERMHAGTWEAVAAEIGAPSVAA